MNVNDYLVWRGDIPLCEEFPFNEVDSLILSRFSYLPFNKINLEDSESIESIASKMKDFDFEDYKIDGDKDLINNLGNSARFKDLVVTNYAANTDKEAERQFGAVTIHLSSSEMYVSFIGTDNTIIGWKEDCNMSFMTHVPAQIEGVKYLNNIASKYNKKIRIGGHSKGGNVAVYSALFTDKLIQDRIIKVTNYDGPGFDKDVVDGNKVISKVLTYIPQDSVIGRLLEHEEDYEVVQSTAKGLYQHDIYSWQVLKTSLVKVDHVTDSSEFINSTIRQWLKETTPEQRKIFVDGIFDLLYSANTETFRELSKTWVTKIPDMMNTYKELSKEDKILITNMLKEFGKASTTTFKNNSMLKMKEFEEKYFKE